MSNENHSQFDDFLAQAAEPEEFESEKDENTNDPAESLQKGLINFYIKYLDQIEGKLTRGLIDEGVADSLTNQVLALTKKDGLENKIIHTTLEKAQEIMGPDSFFGPREVKNAFGIEITEQIPLIPFSPEELERAKELGQFLVLRINQTANGQPLTMQKIKELLQPEFYNKEKGLILWIRDWYNTESFFTSQTPTMGWALTTRQTIRNSKGKNYLEQTEVLADYLKDQVFAGTRLPSEYSDVIAEFEASKDEIRRLVESDWQVASQKLSELRINQLFRQSAVEVLYDELIYFQNTNEWILESEYTWTNTWVFSGDGTLVFVGYIDSRGADVGSRAPGYFSDNHGVSFSRRGADLKL